MCFLSLILLPNGLFGIFSTSFQHLESSPSSDVIKTDQLTNNDTVLLHDVEQNNNDVIDDVLPPNVVLVSSFPATSDSPSHPFRITDRAHHPEAISEKGYYTLIIQVVYSTEDIPSCKPRCFNVVFWSKKGRDVDNVVSTLNQRCFTNVVSTSIKQSCFHVD